MGLMCLALTLTNCQKAQIEEVNPSPEANFELFASPAVATDAAITRTTNDGLATKWATGDQINIFHAPAGSTTYTNDKAFTLKDAATGSFGGTVGALDGGSYDWYAFYPYTSQITTPANTSAGWVVVGGKTPQTQIQNGNNSRTHLSRGACPLFGIAKAVESSAVPSIEMNHLTSIIKVQVTNNSSEDLKVENVSFTGTEDIVGTYYINFAASPVGYKPSGNQYVSNTASLEVKNGEVISSGASADFYIAVKPFTAKTGTTLKLAVNGYEKTLTLKNDITFTAGHIKPLNFNYDTKLVWTLVSDANTLAAGDKLVIASNTKGKVASSLYSGYLKEESATFSSDNLTIESLPSSALVLTLGGASGNWTLANGNGLLLGATKAKKLAFGDGTTLWSISITNTGTTTIQNGTSANGRLLHNVNDARFTTYTSNANAAMLLPQIYRLESVLPSLATPEVHAEVRDVNSVYALWGEIAGAKDYTVTCGEHTFTTATTEHTFTNLAYSTEYTVSVVANPSDETVNTPSAAGKSEIVKTGANPAETVVETKIDFEAELTTYVDWSFANIARNNTIAAKAGSYYGKTTRTTSAYAATKGIIAKPKNVSFSISKETTNTTSSNWKVQVSTNNKDWTDVKSVSATDMSKGVWKDYSVDLASYKDVYVRIYYTGTTAIRCIDEVVLSYVK